jgi:hypothetical protein
MQIIHGYDWQQFDVDINLLLDDHEYANSYDFLKIST